jgi:hypothetical protein
MLLPIVKSVTVREQEWVRRRKWGGRWRDREWGRERERGGGKGKERGQGTGRQAKRERSVEVTVSSSRVKNSTKMGTIPIPMISSMGESARENENGIKDDSSHALS